MEGNIADLVALNTFMKIKNSHIDVKFVNDDFEGFIQFLKKYNFITDMDAVSYNFSMGKKPIIILDLSRIGVTKELFQNLVKLRDDKFSIFSLKGLTYQFKIDFISSIIAYEIYKYKDKVIADYISENSTKTKEMFITDLLNDFIYFSY